MAEVLELYEQICDPEYQRGYAARTMQMRWLLTKALEALPSARTLLDVGAGTGLLVAEANARGLDAVGIEPSRALVRTARLENGVEVYEGTVPNPGLSNRRFDLVCIVDVIEHVSNPVKLLRDCAGLLSQDGIMLVVTPDVSSFAAAIMRKRWWHFRLAHIGYFSPHSLNTAAQKAGLERISSFRAKWFFPIQYIAERLAVYLPLGAINKAAHEFAPLSWFYKKVIPLNLHDSMVCLFKLGDCRRPQ